MQRTLQVLINEELAFDNLIQFPQDTDITTAIVLHREDPDDKFYLVFDVRKNQYIRRVGKKDMSQEAFAINHTGKTLIYVDGDKIYLKSVRLPNSALVIDMLKPRIKHRFKSVTAAQVSS